VRVGGCILVLLHADLEGRLRRACQRRGPVSARACICASGCGVFPGGGGRWAWDSSAGPGSEHSVVLVVARRRRRVVLVLVFGGAASLPRARRDADADAGGGGFALSASRRVVACRSQCGLHRVVRLRGAQACRLVPCAGRLVRSGRYIDPRAVRGPLC
jgi:hypothetical protein